jgi:biopolymer transport protein TolR
MAMHLPSSRGRGRRAPMAEINVTPLVDVMLVLLIIFMVTAPLLTAGVPVNLPESRAKALEQDQKPVQIAINEKGEVYLDNQLVGDAELPAALERVAAQIGPDGKPPQIVFRGDKAISWDKGMHVLGELNRAGIKRIALVGQPSAK